MTDLTLALDVGGTKIAAGLVDSRGRLVHSAKRPTPSGDAEQVWAVVDGLVTEALAEAGAVRGVGIGSAGPIDLTAGTVSPINIASWRGFPLRQRVAALVEAAVGPAAGTAVEAAVEAAAGAAGGAVAGATVGAAVESAAGAAVRTEAVPVRLAGDGLCVALAEQWVGAGRGAAFLLGMVVSTGIGGGLVLDGVPYDGRTGNAGHIGHVIVDLDGPACRCGGRGCAEAIAAGPRMAAWARDNGWRAPPDADAKELADAAVAGDPIAQRAFIRGATAVAAAIASVAAVCDLDRAVIGGGVAKSGALLFDPLREALARHARLDYLRGLTVLPAELGGDAGLIGAAALISGPHTSCG